MIISLNQAAAGLRGTVVALAGGTRFQERVVSMGLDIGREVEVLQASCNGNGPVRLAVGETRLALGHGMAGKVMIAVDPE